MPRTVYGNKRSSDHFRYDSLFTNVSGSSWQATQTRKGSSKAAAPPPLHLWYALMVALTDRSKTASIVEGLLHLVSPEMDVPKFLVRIGDPAQRLREGEDDMLREKLREILFPEYYTLF